MWFINDTYIVPEAIHVCLSGSDSFTNRSFGSESSAHLSYDRALHILSVGVSDSFTNHNYGSLCLSPSFIIHGVTAVT